MKLYQIEVWNGQAWETVAIRLIAGLQHEFTAQDAIRVLRDLVATDKKCYRIVEA